MFQLNSHPPLADLPSFADGWFYIQDPSTLLAVRELAPKSGETILDFCAAPGGKLTYIAQLMGNDGQLIAQDLTPQRIKLIKENCARMGVSSVEGSRSAAVSAAAATNAKERWKVTGSLDACEAR